MPLPSSCVRRPVATAMACVAACVLGAISLARMPVELLPDIALPTLTIRTAYPGAGPSGVERFVTEPVERAVARVPGVQRVSTVSSEGASLVTIRFAWGTDMDYAALNVRRRLDRLRYELPSTVGRPTILRADPGSEPVLTIAASGPDLRELKPLTETVFLQRLEQIDGVARAAVVGGLEREIRIEVDPERLQGFGVSIEELSKALVAANYSAVGGTIRRGGYRYALRALGEFRSVDEIGATPLKRGPAGTLLLVRDVAAVEDGFATRETVVRYNGRESIGIPVFKEAGRHTVRIAKRVETVLAGLRGEFPEVDLQVVSTQARFISEALSNIVSALVLGGLLAALVLLLFLHDARYPLAVALSIPISLAVAFGLLNAAGVSLNLMSLGGLALGVGMLVDSSIVVLENIFRHRAAAAGATEAASRGAEEVQTAITAATLTTAAVFVPVVYVEGVAGQVFRDLSLAVAFSLLASLAVALTILPVVASRLLSRDAYPTAGRLPGADHSVVERFSYLCDRSYDRFADRYDALLAWSLDRKGCVLALAAASLAVALAAGWTLRRDVLPPLDEGTFRVRLALPLGTPLEVTERVTTWVEERLRADAGVRAVFSRVGRARATDAMGPSAGAHAAWLDVRLREGVASRAVLDRLRTQLSALPTRLRGALWFELGRTAALRRGLGLTGADLAVRVRGHDLGKASALAHEVRRRLAGVRELANARVGFSTGRPEIHIEVDRERAARHGLGVREVADAVQAFLRGLISTQFVRFNEKVDVVVRPPDSVRDDWVKLGSFTLSGVPLRELVDVREALGPVEILRERQERVVPVYADVAHGGLGQAISRVQRALEGLPVPTGLRLEVAGGNEEMRESFRSLAFALALALLLVYLILAAQFESLIHPFTVLLSVPLAAIGAVLALRVVGHGLNVISLIGIVVLVGIAVNNAIVEVDFMNRARRAGAPVRRAVLEAGRVRLRPILMTTVTTILGLVPMAFGVGADLRAPLAVAVIGGLVSSALLTLVVVPAAYEAAERARSKVAAALARARLRASTRRPDEGRM